MMISILLAKPSNFDSNLDVSKANFFTDFYILSKDLGDEKMLIIPSTIVVRHWNTSIFMSKCTLLFVLDVVFIDGSSCILYYRYIYWIILSSPEYSPTTIFCLALWYLRNVLVMLRANFPLFIAAATFKLISTPTKSLCGCNCHTGTYIVLICSVVMFLVFHIWVLAMIIVKRNMVFP